MQYFYATITTVKNDPAVIIGRHSGVCELSKKHTPSEVCSTIHNIISGEIAEQLAGTSAENNYVVTLVAFNRIN